MDLRVQNALDGEIARSGLSHAEAERCAEAERLIDDVVAAVPDATLPELGPSVLRRLEALRPERASKGAATGRKSLFAWLLTPRPRVFVWRPVYGFGMAAALAAVLMWSQARPGAPISPSGVPQVLVQFRLDAPGARNVALAGDFTGWKPAHALRRSEPGVWTVIVPLHPGIHDYAFVVDGQRWVADPMAPAIADGFGGMNSRLAVLAPDGARGI